MKLLCSTDNKLITFGGVYAYGHNWFCATHLAEEHPEYYAMIKSAEGELETYKKRKRFNQVENRDMGTKEILSLKIDRKGDNGPF